MKKIIHVNTKTKQIEHRHFSGVHGDIFELVGKNVENITGLRVQSPSGKLFTIFHDVDQNMYKYNNYVVFCNTMIWGDMVIVSLTPDQMEFNNVSKEDFEVLKPLFDFE